MSLMTAFAIPSAPMHEWMAPNGTGYTLRIDPSVWSRGQKLETFPECPAAALSDDQERELWDFYPTERDDEYDITDDVYGEIRMRTRISGRAYKHFFCKTGFSAR